MLFSHFRMKILHLYKRQKIFGNTFILSRNCFENFTYHKLNAEDLDCHYI